MQLRYTHTHTLNCFKAFTQIVLEQHFLGAKALQTKLKGHKGSLWDYTFSLEMTLSLLIV